MLSYNKFLEAVDKYKQVDIEGLIKNRVLTVVDYSIPSYHRRMFLFDMSKFNGLHMPTPPERIDIMGYLVAHGKNSGGTIPHSFSNKIGSLQSSLGAILTQGTYVGKYGRSLKLRGLEKGVNDNIGVRTVVVHGSKYVSDEYAKEHGSIGRSWGCLAVDFKHKDLLIDTIKGGSLIVSLS